jgi:hypothetical protein
MGEELPRQRRTRSGRRRNATPVHQQPAFPPDSQCMPVLVAIRRFRSQVSQQTEDAHGDGHHDRRFQGIQEQLRLNTRDARGLSAICSKP